MICEILSLSLSTRDVQKVLRRYFVCTLWLHCSDILVRIFFVKVWLVCIPSLVKNGSLFVLCEWKTMANGNVSPQIWYMPRHSVSYTRKCSWIWNSLSFVCSVQKSKYCNKINNQLLGEEFWVQMTRHTVVVFCGTHVTNGDWCWYHWHGFLFTQYGIINHSSPNLVYILKVHSHRTTSGDHK